jgi:hypothetical protein
MKTTMKGIALVMFSVLLVTACSKDDNNSAVQPLNELRATDIIADTIIGFSATGQPFGSGKFTFFSLENNRVVPSSDSNSTKWDLGFRGTTIITNSGVSGPGNGGGFVQVGTFEDLKMVAADSVFRTDVSPSNLAIPAGSNRAWFVYNPQANLVTPIPGRVLVIRTALGKFAKVEILNYYKGGVTPLATASDDDKIRKQRYYTFRFMVQPDGSKKLSN